ncbi:acyltransferase family protein [Sinomonas sp. JGH33]|uniref:Acyltransferase family protein n=1 Tax=Sinomonas terricola TaxID=3110330 RepID=A0ABU5T175_9MICC|nr:acyltransferase family protein [Sinomonas sp. JGH33]MEA5453398.1 acyltransferase family protein [Sinomonas sp. JGH33]
MTLAAPSPGTPSPAREAGIDLLRVVGVIAVVAGHVFEGPWVQRGIYGWHVPLFFFLSGYFWSRGRTLAEEAARRSRALLRPYVFWLSVIGVPFVALRLLEGQGAKDAALPLVLGGAYLTRPFSAFWFVTALFAACLAFRLLERQSMPVKAGVVAAALLACQLAPRYVAHVPAAVGTAFAALVFMYAGQCARAFGPQLPTVWIGWAALAVGGVLAGGGTLLPLDLKQALFGTPVASVAAAILICAGLTRLAETYGALVPPRAGRWISSLAQSAIMVVLSHSAVLEVLGTRSETWWPGFPLALGVPWAIGLLLLGTPAAPWVLGVERVKGLGGRRRLSPPRAR